MVSQISDLKSPISLSEEFVDAVDGRLPEAVRLALWVLREVTRCSDPARAAAILEHLVDAAVAGAVVDLLPQRTLPPLTVARIRGMVIEAVLGERGRCELVGADLGLAGATHASPAVAGLSPPGG